MAQSLTQVDENLCTLCGLCVDACPCGAVQLVDEQLIFSCQEACCHICLEAIDDWCLCEEVCPTGAITCAFEIVVEVDRDPKET